MSGAAITVMNGPDGQEPVCATDAAAARIDELQFSLGEGPCVEAFATGRPVLVADIDDPVDARRWPIFAASAVEVGVRGMFVFPLGVGAARLGVLDCYRDVPGTLTDPELAGALRVADAAVWALLERIDVHAPVEAPMTADGTGTGDWLDGAPLRHAEVHQATGMVMASSGVDARSALAQLRAVAFTQGRALHDVALDVLARKLWLGTDSFWHAPISDSVVVDDGPTDEQSGNEEKSS